MKFEKPVIIVSRCLEFDHCRWNGLMIESATVKNLKNYADFRPVCPEKEIGLGIPRKPLRLVNMADGIHMVQNETGRDVTREMNLFSGEFLDNAGDFDGCILKDRSPSCGNRDVKLYPSLGKVSPLTSKETGLFGRAVLERYGNLPVENEGRLNNYSLREHFFTGIFTLARFRKIKQGAAISQLMDFQADNKLLLMAYNQNLMRQMGRLLANHEKKLLESIKDEYGSLLCRALKKMPRYTSNINVLMHAFGYFSKRLTSAEKSHFLDMLEQYRNHQVPLSSCISMLYSWIVRFDEPYLQGQTYFRPYPVELMNVSDSGKGRHPK